MKAPDPYLIWRETRAEQGEADERTLGKRQINVWLRNAALLTLAFIVVPPLPFQLPLLWLLSMATGYAAAALIAVVMLLPLRNLMLWPEQRISVDRHKWLALLALVFTALHTALFLVSDTVALEYLWLSQPRYMLAGYIGLVLLAFLYVTSLERPRIALFGLHTRFRTIHIALSITLVVMTAAHMIGSTVYVAHPLKAGLCALIAAGLVTVTLKRPKPSAAPAPETVREAAP